MSTPSHILSSSFIAITAAHIAPSQTGYIVIALISGGIADLDHLYYFLKDWSYYKKKGFIGKMHHARSLLHEMAGFTFAGTVLLVLSIFHLKLALVLCLPYMLHIAQDIIMGVSTPFTPIDNTKIHVIPQNMKIKITIDISVIFIFGLLWIIYLKGAKLPRLTELF